MGMKLKEKKLKSMIGYLNLLNCFCTHVRINPDAHLDLHELGMELCSEALEESITWLKYSLS